MPIIPTIPNFQVTANPNVFGHVTDIAAQRALKAKAERESIFNWLKTAAIIVVGVATTLVTAGAGSGVLAASLAGAGAGSAVQIGFETIKGDLSEESAKDVAINFGVAILTAGVGKVFSIGKNVLTKALVQYTEISEGVMKLTNANNFSEKIINFLIKKGIPEKILKTGYTKTVFSDILKEKGFLSALKLNEIENTSLSIIEKLFHSFVYVIEKSGVSLSQEIDNLITGSLKSTLKFKIGFSLKRFLQKIYKKLFTYFKKLLRRFLPIRKIEQLLKRYRNRLIRQTKKIIKPVTDRIFRLKKKFTKIVGENKVYRQLFRHRKEQYRKVVEAAKKSGDQEKLNDLDNYIAQRTALVPLSSDWILGYTLWTNKDNPDVADLTVYFKAQLTLTRIKRRKRKRPKITKEPMTFYKMTLDEINNFVNASSVGAYYLKHLKGKGVVRSTINKRLNLNKKTFVEREALGLKGSAAPLVKSLVRIVGKDNEVVKQAFKIGSKVGEVKSWIADPVGNLFNKGENLFAGNFKKVKVIKF